MTDEKMSPAGWAAQSIADLAAALRKRFDAEAQPTVDLAAIVHHYGGTVRYEAGSEADKDLRESLTVQPDGSFEILLPVHTPLSRDRFTIAHELGHYFLHWKEAATRGRALSEPVRFARSGLDASPDTEAEANTFAVALLMPERLFGRAWKRAAGDAAVVAAEFGVSASAARSRAAALGLTNR